MNAPCKEIQRLRTLVLNAADHSRSIGAGHKADQLLLSLNRTANSSIRLMTPQSLSFPESDA